MAYIKTTWKNKMVERPRTFRQQQNADGTVTLIPSEGNIIEPGTPVDAQNMNKMEEALSEFDAFKSTKNKPGGLAGLDESGSLELAIGDMKQSLMPLDNTWLKCDGTQYPALKYEELYEYLGSPTDDPYVKEWIKRPFNKEDGDIFKVVYFKARWIAMAIRGQTWYSLDDGISWENGNPVGYEGVVNSNSQAKILNGDLYVIYRSKIYKTTDGINWSSSDLPPLLGDANGFDYGNGKFVVINYNNGMVTTSVDGVTWTAPTKIKPGENLKGNDIIYIDGTFYLSAPNNLYKSTDGITFTYYKEFTASSSLFNVNGNLVISVYKQGVYIRTGEVWERIASIKDELSYPMMDIQFFNGMYLIGYKNATMATSTELKTTGWVLDTTVVNGSEYHVLKSLGMNPNTGTIMGMGFAYSVPKPCYVNMVVDKRNFTLPNINNYTYIKAKGV